MNPNLAQVLSVLGYFLIALLVFLVFCIWDRLSSQKISFHGCLFLSVFWPVAILIGAFWWFFSLLEIAYEKIANRK